MIATGEVSYGAMKILQITTRRIAVIPKIHYIKSPFLPNFRLIESPFFTNPQFIEFLVRQTGCQLRQKWKPV